jgi:hypothetical protein
MNVIVGAGFGRFAAFGHLFRDASTTDDNAAALKHGTRVRFLEEGARGPALRTAVFGQQVSSRCLNAAQSRRIAPNP